MARILIADDDEMVRDIVGSVLGDYGHIVGTVANGEEAVHAAELKQPDLIILDCLMPGLSGVDALRRIRMSANVSAIPVLMLTARESRRDEDIAMCAGANDYLRKPFDPTELLVRVENLLWKQARRYG